MDTLFSFGEVIVALFMTALCLGVIGGAIWHVIIKPVLGLDNPKRDHYNPYDLSDK